MMSNLNRKVRSKKLNAKVDLTAMVSVSFLLIIFFMVVNELAKPKVLVLEPPTGCDDCWGYPYEGENRSVTLLLGENNKLVSYMGILEMPIIAPKEIKYGKEGIRKQLAKLNKRMLGYAAKLGKPGRGITVIIKPTKKSNYGNLVDILDEMKIANITSYSIIPEFTPEESKLIASN